MVISNYVNMATKNNLTPNQLHILRLLYKFRFLTASLIAEYRGISVRAVNDALTILLNNELVSRRYDKTYKLLGKSARYHLSTKALKLLKTEDGIDGKVLHARYKDKQVNESFVNHNLSIVRLYLDIESKYPNTFEVFTKAELANDEEMIKPLPDLYLSRVESDPSKPDEYFIDIINSSMIFIAKNRVDEYINHMQSGEWDSDYPNVILICQDDRFKVKLDKYIESAMDNKYLDEDDIDIVTEVSLELGIGQQNTI